LSGTLLCNLGLHQVVVLNLCSVLQAKRNQRINDGLRFDSMLS